MKRFFILFAFSSSLAISAGCSFYLEQPKSVDEVLKEDPGFAFVLEKKKILDEKIKAVDEEFKKEKDSLNVKIKAIEDDMRKKRQETNNSIQDIKKELEPERNAIRENIRQAKASLSDRQNTLKNIDKMLLDVAKLLQKGADLKMTEEERAKWEERMGALNR